MLRLNKRAESILQNNIPDSVPINLVIASGIAEHIKCSSCPAINLCNCYVCHNRVSLNTCVNVLYRYIEGEKVEEVTSECHTKNEEKNQQEKKP